MKKSEKKQTWLFGTPSFKKNNTPSVPPVTAPEAPQKERPFAHITNDAEIEQTLQRILNPYYKQEHEDRREKEPEKEGDSTRHDAKEGKGKEKIGERKVPHTFWWDPSGAREDETFQDESLMEEEIATMLEGFTFTQTEETPYRENPYYHGAKNPLTVVGELQDLYERIIKLNESREYVLTTPGQPEGILEKMNDQMEQLVTQFYDLVEPHYIDGHFPSDHKASEIYALCASLIEPLAKAPPIQEEEKEEVVLPAISLPETIPSTIKAKPVWDSRIYNELKDNESKKIHGQISNESFTKNQENILTEYEKMKQAYTTAGGKLPPHGKENTRSYLYAERAKQHPSWVEHLKQTKNKGRGV